MSDYYYVIPRKDSNNRYAMYFELKSLYDPATFSFPIDMLRRISVALRKLSLGRTFPEDFVRNLERIAEEYECHYYAENK